MQLYNTIALEKFLKKLKRYFKILTCVDYVNCTVGSLFFVYYRKCSLKPQEPIAPIVDAAELWFFLPIRKLTFTLWYNFPTKFLLPETKTFKFVIFWTDRAYNVLCIFIRKSRMLVKWNTFFEFVTPAAGYVYNVNSCNYTICLFVWLSVKLNKENQHFILSESFWMTSFGNPKLRECTSVRSLINLSDYS